MKLIKFGTKLQKKKLKILSSAKFPNTNPNIQDFDEMEFDTFLTL